jgi:hypothetical protein
MASNMTTATMKPLHLLRALYRQLKTPAMHVSKEITKQRSVDHTASVAQTAIATTSNSKSRSNASTRFLMQQYRLASLSSATPNTTTTEVHHNTTTSRLHYHQQQQQQLQRFATELYLLRHDIHQRGELYLIDTGADQQLSPHELSRRAAARAGLQLPEQYKE